MLKEYKTVTRVAGPLLFVEKTDAVGYGELVSIKLSDGSVKNGQVLDTSADLVVVQVDYHLGLGSLGMIANIA